MGLDVESQDGNFATALAPKFLQILYSIGKELCFDPLGSIEAERYFLGLQTVAWESGKTEMDLEKELKASFVSLDSPPVWIQCPQWQFEDGEPMLFVGQIDSAPTSIIGDKSFYLFLSKKTGNTKTVVQSS